MNTDYRLITQPEPMAPTDEELRAAYDEVCWGEMDADNFIKATRAVLQRWGRPAITPIPVSERLPGPEDCDAEGRCWWAWAVGQVWSFCSPPPYRATHWLPAHALPLPATPENVDG